MSFNILAITFFEMLMTQVFFSVFILIPYSYPIVNQINIGFLTLNLSIKTLFHRKVKRHLTKIGKSDIFNDRNNCDRISTAGEKRRCTNPEMILKTESS